MRRFFGLQAAGALLLLAAPLTSGCHKRPSGPSEHYDRGAAIHQELYVRELDDAYLDPKMDEAVGELKQVPADSVSAHLAQELLKQIDKGRKEAAAARDARQKALAAAQQPIVLDPNKILAAGAPAPAAVATAVDPADAGAAVLDPYGPGAPIADINRDTGGCLVAGTPFREEGSGKEGATYKLAEDPVCRGKLPGFVNQTVLALDGRIYRRVSSSEVKTEKVLPGAPTLLPDGGVPPQGPAAAAIGSPRSDAAVVPNVAGQQGATPAPAAPYAPRASPSNSATNATNVAAEQNATPPPAPPANIAPAQMQDATPPPAQ